MSDQPRPVYKRNASIAALPLYYSGHLLKKTKKEKDFESFYGELRGTQLFLYTHDAQDTYTEKLDLEQVKSMDLKSPYLTKKSTIFTLTLPTEDVQLKMDNPVTAEEWRGYILTMAKKVIPRKLNLMPGQILQMQEALDQEMRRRNLPMSCPPSLPPRNFLPSATSSPSASSSSTQTAIVKPNPNNSDMPACFFNVTRNKAESMLETNPQFGSIILRPSSEGGYALTLRHLLPSGPVLRNYRVTRAHTGLIIHLDTPVRVCSFSDVLDHFFEKTEYRLHPYVESQVYDTHIDQFSAQQCNSITSPTPSNIPRVPVVQSQEPVLPAAKPVEADYMVPDDQSSYINQRPDPKENECEQRLGLRREARYADMSRDEDPKDKSIFKGSSDQVEWIRQKAAE